MSLQPPQSVKTLETMDSISIPYESPRSLNEDHRMPHPDHPLDRPTHQTEGTETEPRADQPLITDGKSETSDSEGLENKCVETEATITAEVRDDNIAEEGNSMQEPKDLSFQQAIEFWQRELEDTVALERYPTKNIGDQQANESYDSSDKRRSALMSLGGLYYDQYQQLGNPGDLDNAIILQNQAVLLTPDGHPDKPTLLDNLGESYTQRFEDTDELADIDEAIECQNQATLLTPDGHADMPGRLNHLGNSYMCRYERCGDATDIDKAIACQSQSVQLTSDTHAVKQIRLNNLGNSHMRRFECHGEAIDADKAIGYLSQAVMLTPEDHVNRPGRLNNLGASYMRRFGHFGEVTDIDQAIECQSQAVLLTVDGHAAKPSRLSNLGSSYRSRFEHFGELADINMAIQNQIQAVSLTANGRPEKSIMLGNLGGSYMRRFEHRGELTDIATAIETQCQAVLFTPDDHSSKPGLLNCLGNSYLCRFERHGLLTDVNQAIHSQSQAVHLTPDGHADKPHRLNDLGNSYMRRFERSGDLPDIERAIECQKQAVLHTPDSHVNKPKLLSNLGNSYLCRFERYGELADINGAITYQSQAMLLIPDGYADKPTLLNNLGSSYLSRFERHGELADIDKAIDCQGQAMLLTPEGHAAKPGWLNNLGNSYLRRFERHGEAEDIDKAIECQRQAVLLTPDAHAGKSTLLNSLGHSYTCRFEHSGGIVDINQAIECLNQAVLLAPDAHADKSRWLSNLGNSYLSRFESSNEATDVDKAIDCHRRAVFLTPEEHSDKATLLNNLGSSYAQRFQHFGKVVDINEAIGYQSQAVSLLPDGHAEKPRFFRNLGRSYMRRSEQNHNLLDVETASTFFKQAAQIAISHPRVQIRSALEWANASHLLGISPLPAYQRTMDLIPMLAWLGTTIDRRYDLLSELGDVVMEAASGAISVQAYDIAIEWLEVGRSIVWNQMLQLRTPFDELSAADNVLAERMRDIGRQLEAAGSRATGMDSATVVSPDLEREAQQHRRLADEWEQLVQQARQIPGFSNFMLPRKAHELLRAAWAGPVVVINVHETRCDALILRPNTDSIAHVPLGNLSINQAKGTRELLASLVGHRGTRSRGLILRPHESTSNFSRVLAMLWSDITKPILDYLGYTQKLPVDDLPRVTWCTTGELSFLPLHAAGHYDGIQPSVHDLVVSSYTPTLSALLSPEPQTPGAHAGLLAVGQEEYSSGLENLPFTSNELVEVKKHAKQTRYMQLDGREATVDAVLKAMGEHSWVHLACHATQNRDSAAHSAFHLRDGSLTLETIAKRSFKNKGLAFLSACQTAAGDEKLPEEAVHLAAGMLMAGYQNVIATMWSIWDVDGPEVAGAVYAELLKNGTMDCQGAARALHKAVVGLREKVGQDSFKRWVPFIHIGV